MGERETDRKRGGCREAIIRVKVVVSVQALCGHCCSFSK